MDSQLNIYIDNTQSIELKAQEICKEAVFTVAYQLSFILKEMEERHMVTDIEINVEVYNRGYLLKYNFRNLVDMETLRRMDEAVLIFLEGYRKDIWLQPDSFFNEYISEGKFASMEGSVFEMKERRAHIRNLKINTVDDIQNTANEFVKTNVETLNHISILI